MGRKAQGVFHDPLDEREQKFAEALLKNISPRQAWIQAGYAVTGYGRHGTNKLRSLSKYLDRMRAKVEQAVAHRIVLDQATILDEMMAIAFANPQDYIEEYDAEEVTDGVKKIVRRRRTKDLMQLTRHQAAAIGEITLNKDGSITYRIPDRRGKRPYLKDLGMHLGLYHQKLIHEHRHAHMHAHVDLKDIPPAKLEAAEAALLELLGSKGALLLGIPAAMPDEDDED